jgi:DNA polymerase V
MTTIILETGPLPAIFHLTKLNAPSVRRPLYGFRIPAGFPSPAEEYVDRLLDLNEYLIKNAVSTFYFRAQGHSMRNARIFDGDLLTVDRSIEPKHGHIVLAMIDGEFTCKRLYVRGRIVELHPESPDFQPIRFAEGQELRILGIVTGSVSKFQV